MARRRTARGVKTVGLRPFVVEDVAAAGRNATAPDPSAPSVSLAGRELLDERVRAWKEERARFERSRRPRAPVATARDPTIADREP